MRAALINGETVVNVIEYDPEADYEPGEGVRVQAVADDSVVGTGWRVRNGDFVPPPTETLLAEPLDVVADGIAESVVTYTNTCDEAPTQVEFDVNGSKVTEDVTDGRAQIAVVASVPGPVVVTARGHMVTINGTEVRA